MHVFVVSVTDLCFAGVRLRRFLGLLSPFFVPSPFLGFPSHGRFSFHGLPSLGRLNFRAASARTSLLHSHFLDLLSPFLDPSSFLGLYFHGRLNFFWSATGFFVVFRFGAAIFTTEV